MPGINFVHFPRKKVLLKAVGEEASSSSPHEKTKGGEKKKYNHANSYYFLMSRINLCNEKKGGGR